MVASRGQIGDCCCLLHFWLIGWHSLSPCGTKWRPWSCILIVSGGHQRQPLATGGLCISHGGYQRMLGGHLLMFCPYGVFWEPYGAKQRPWGVGCVLVVSGSISGHQCHQWPHTTPYHACLYLICDLPRCWGSFFGWSNKPGLFSGTVAFICFNPPAQLAVYQKLRLF